MADLGYALGLGFGELGVGGDHADGGVRAGQNRQRRHARQQTAAGVAQALAACMSGACNQGASVGVYHIAQGIAGYQGTDCHAAHGDGRGTDAAFHGALHAKQFAHAGAAACAHIALRRSLRAGVQASGVTGLRIRSNAGVAQGQIKQHGRRHDRHAGGAHVQTNALLVQPAHHAACRVQAPGAAARQKHGMHLVHSVAGFK